MNNLLKTLTVRQCMLILQKGDFKINIANLLIDNRIEVTEENYLLLRNNVTGLLLANAYKKSLELFIK